MEVIRKDAEETPEGRTGDREHDSTGEERRLEENLLRWWRNGGKLWEREKRYYVNEVKMEAEGLK